MCSLMVVFGQTTPILVGMIDAIRMTKSGDRIEIFSLGTCPRPPGDIFDAKDMHRGPLGWKFGGEVVMTALDAQRFAYDNMADMLAEHLDRDCSYSAFSPRRLTGREYAIFGFGRD